MTPRCPLRFVGGSHELPNNAMRSMHNKLSSRPTRLSIVDRDVAAPILRPHASSSRFLDRLCCCVSPSNVLLLQTRLGRRRRNRRDSSLGPSEIGAHFKRRKRTSDNINTATGAAGGGQKPHPMLGTHSQCLLPRSLPHPRALGSSMRQTGVYLSRHLYR